MNITEKVNQMTINYQTMRNEVNKVLKIKGKTMNEWQKEFFTLNIPQDASPLVCKQQAVVLAEKEQFASALLTGANARFHSVKETYEDEFRKKYREIEHEYTQTNGKKPAANYLDQMATLAVTEWKAMVTIAELEKNFWKDIVAALGRRRKILDNIAMNNAHIIKTMPGYGEPDNTYNPFEEEGSEEDIS